MQAEGTDRGDGVLSQIELVQLIECELHVGVSEAIVKYGKSSKAHVPYPVDWLKGWEAKVTLKMTVDDKGSLTPGVTLTKPLANALSHYNVSYGQSFSFTAGLQASSQATRVQTLAYTVPFSTFSDATLPPQMDCKNQIKNKVVLSDLKIQDFIADSAATAALADSVSYRQAAPYSVFNDEVTFIVTYAGNINPVWKLIDVTANANSPLYSATRSRTHDILVTLSAPQNQEAVAVHNAQLVGQAVAAALRNQ